MQAQALWLSRGAVAEEFSVLALCWGAAESCPEVCAAQCSAECKALELRGQEGIDVHTPSSTLQQLLEWCYFTAHFSKGLANSRVCCSSARHSPVCGGRGSSDLAAKMSGMVCQVHSSQSSPHLLTVQLAVSLHLQLLAEVCATRSGFPASNAQVDVE